MKKILVLGGSGLVGSVFANYSQSNYDLHLTYNDNPIIKGKGSAIFLHLSKKNIIKTKGCIAVEKKNMINLLKYCPKKIKIY